MLAAFDIVSLARTHIRHGSDCSCCWGLTRGICRFPEPVRSTSRHKLFYSRSRLAPGGGIYYTVIPPEPARSGRRHLPYYTDYISPSDIPYRFSFGNSKAGHHERPHHPALQSYFCKCSSKKASYLKVTSFSQTGHHRAHTIKSPTALSTRRLLIFRSQVFHRHAIKSSTALSTKRLLIFRSQVFHRHVIKSPTALSTKRLLTFRSQVILRQVIIEHTPSNFLQPWHFRNSTLQAPI